MPVVTAARVRELSLALALVGLTLLASPLEGARAEKLRIAPDELKVRSQVSDLLAPSLRLQLRDLAAATPLPREDGLVQTSTLLDDAFSDRDWDENRQKLVRYYFLVARMEKSRDFSEEFTRRRKVTEEGITLLDAYLKDLNRAIAQAVFVPNVEIETPEVAQFPLASVGWVKNEGRKTQLRVLHAFPPVDTDLGRETLRAIRDVAVSDVERLKAQTRAIDAAERTFLEEVSLVGKALIALRPQVERLVRAPRAGLPFSF